MAKGQESDKRGREKPTSLSRKEYLTLGTMQRSFCHKKLQRKEKSFNLLATCSLQITGHVLYHVNMEMRQTTCQKFETTNCSFQEGEIYKVLCECTLIQEELTGVFCGIRMREGRITGGIFKPA